MTQGMTAPRHPDAYLTERSGRMSTAIGLARSALSKGDPAGAAAALDDCCDSLHELLWDSCLADGHDPEKIDLVIGPRDRKAIRSWPASTTSPFRKPQLECAGCGGAPDHVYCQRWLERIRRFFGGKPL